MNNRKLPRSAAEVASFGDLRGYYDRLIKQQDEIHKELRMSRAGHRGDRKDLEETRTEVKKVKKIVFTLTKKQKAAEQAVMSGLWSGAAAFCFFVNVKTIFLTFFTSVRVSSKSFLSPRWPARDIRNSLWISSCCLINLS
jgi:hypothetical protein